MDKVINMSDYRPDRTTSEVPKNSARLIRVTQLKAANKIKGNYLSSGDQRRVAENMHRILTSYQVEHNVKKSEVAIRTGLGTAGTDSTKRLYTLTLPPSAVENEKRLKSLSKKANNYFAIAKTLSVYGYESEDELLLQIFESCAFGSKVSFETNLESERWDRFVSLLEDMTRNVCRATNMEEYWRELAIFSGKFDVRSDTIAFGTDSLDWNYQPLAGNLYCSDETPPVPSVPLCKILLGKTNGELALDGNPPQKVKFSFWREIRLAVGPIHKIGDIGPLLENRTVLQARTEDLELIKFDNPFTDGTDTISIAYLGGQEYKVDHIFADEFDEKTQLWITPVPESSFSTPYIFLMGRN